MTSTDIKKALESEIHLAKYVDSSYCDGVNVPLLEATIDLINRYEAEIDQWKQEANKYQTWWAESYNSFEMSENKAEAIKEFAERLKEKCEYIPQQHFTELEVEWWIDNLVKEMTEQRKEDGNEVQHKKV